MRQTTACIYAAVLAALASSPVMAMTDLERMEKTERERAQNLETCLSGRSPETCKKHLLRPGEVKEAERAERRENARNCLGGGSKSKCKKSLLTQSEREEMLEAEKAAAPAVKAPTPAPAPPAAAKTPTPVPAPAAVVPAPPAAKAPAPPVAATVAPAQPTSKPPVATPAQPAAKAPATAAPAQPAAKASTSASAPGAGTNCKAGHVVETVSQNGRLVTLGDNSLWKITGAKGVDPNRWLAGTNIVACDDRLTNSDDKETVTATRSR